MKLSGHLFLGYHEQVDETSHKNKSFPEARTDGNTTNDKCKVELFLKRISNDLLLAVDCGMCAE